MSKGDNHPEQYELDSAELFFCRSEVILRAIYYIYKDCELKQETDHNILKSLIDSLLYNVFTAEEKITARSVNVPTEVPPTEGHAMKNTEKIMKNLNEFYFKQREKAHARINEGKKKRAACKTQNN